MVIARNVRNWWLIHALATAVVWAILHNALEAVFFDAYLRNNPGYAERLSNPPWIPARYFVLLTAPFAGLATGLIIAVLTWIARRLRVFVPSDNAKL